ncbi:hypothetical protein D3C78_803150 [compost metagenome]
MWQDPVTTHGVENPRYRSLRSQGRAQAASDVSGGKEIGQELPARLEHHLVGRRVGIGEMAAGQHQLADVGEQGEQYAGAQCGEDDRSRHGTLCILGFFREGRNRVKTEERQTQHGRTCHQMIEARLAAITEQWREEIDRLTTPQRFERQRDEHADEDDLRTDNQVAGLGHRMYADYVEHGNQSDRSEDDGPHRNAREGDVQEQADQQVIDHRDEQVVEQQRPAGKKADARSKGQVGVGVGGAGDRKTPDHEAVGSRREEHGQQRYQIGPGSTATGEFGDDAVGGEDGQRDHVNQAEEHQGGEAEDTAQLGGVCLGSVAWLLGH